MVPSIPSSGTTVVPRKNGSHRRYTRISWDLLTDPNLRPTDTTVYGIIKASQWGESATIGTRLIAKLARMSKRDIGASIKRLMKLGYIERDSSGIERGRYRVSDKRNVESFIRCSVCEKPIESLMCIYCQGRQDLADAV